MIAHLHVLWERFSPMGQQLCVCVEDPPGLPASMCSNSSRTESPPGDPPITQDVQEMTTKPMNWCPDFGRKGGAE